MTSDGAFGLSLKDGSQKWDITLTDRSVSDYRKIVKIRTWKMITVIVLIMELFNFSMQLCLQMMQTE